jgi:hypothetical protein
MPSAIYWSGLRARHHASGRLDDALGPVRVSERRGAATDEAPSEDKGSASRIAGFASDLPPMPDKFLETDGLNFQLTLDEVRHLRRRVSKATVSTSGRGLQFNLFAEFAGNKVQGFEPNPMSLPQ